MTTCPECKGTGLVPRKVWTQGPYVEAAHPAVNAARPAYRTITQVPPYLFIDRVSRGDARRLVTWWDGHTLHYHERRLDDAGRFWQVWRTR